MWELATLAAVCALAGLGIYTAILTHERDTAYREKAETVADFAQFQQRSAEVISQRLIQNAKDARALEDATLTAMANYQKGKNDAKASYAAIDARIAKLRISTQDNPGSNGGAMPDAQPAAEGVSESCEQRLRNASAQFDEVARSVAEVSTALKAAKEEALTFKALVDYEKARDWPKP
jgi:hypothetical protein